MALIFPFSQVMLNDLRRHFSLHDLRGRAVFTCNRCKVAFVVTPSNVTPNNYDGLMAHALDHDVDGLAHGRLPARVRPFGTRHER